MRVNLCQTFKISQQNDNNYCSLFSFMCFLLNLLFVLFFFSSVPSSVIKRKSLSVGGQKRRSLLPTPVKINKTTRSHSQKLKPSIKAFGSQGALALNISPPAERVVSRIAGVLSDSQLNAKVEPLKSTSSLADPFSPVIHLIPAHTERDNFVSRDSHDTNLIQLSPSLPSEVSDHKSS